MFVEPQVVAVIVGAKNYMTFHKIFTPKIFISSVLVASIAFSSFFSLPERANAQATNLAGCASSLTGGLIGGAGGTVATIISKVAAGAVPVNTVSINAPTFAIAGNTQYANTISGCLDPLAYWVAKVILRQMTQSIITWINTGFEGDPFFLVNPTQYFANLANQQLNQFIWEIQRAPTVFGNQIIATLTRPTRDTYTLGRVVTQECLRQEAEQRVASGQVPPQATTYLAGDATTRLAKAEEERIALELAVKEKAGNNILARVKGFFKDSFATRIVAENNTADAFEQYKILNSLKPGGANTQIFEDGSSIQTFDDGSTLITDTAGGTTATNATGNISIPSTNCPTTVAQQNARVQACLSGNLSFSECGGWAGWYAQTQNCENNLMCATQAAQNKLAARQAALAGQKQAELQQSGGFLSAKECVPGKELYDDEALAGEAEPSTAIIGCREERITTPGRVIAGSILSVTDSSLRQVELINSIGQAVDQILNAFFNQLLTMGLRSVATSITSGLYDSPNYTSSTNSNSKAQLITTALANLNAAEISARRYSVAKTETASTTRDIVNSLNQLSALGGPTGDNCPLTINSASDDISQISQLSATADQYDIELQALSIDLATLMQIKASLTAGDSNALNTAYGIISRLPTATMADAAETERNQTRAKKDSVSGFITACTAENFPTP